ncbi:MAG: sigma-70 family RNA polymerase sigma factor [Anaeromyxobacteraceae bacterium]
MNSPRPPTVPPEEADDLALVSRAQGGDQDAFRTLVVRFQRKVYAVALGIVKDPDLAWDVAQEAFVRVHGRLSTFEGKSAFSTWLFRVTTHLAIDAVRKERTARKDQLEDVLESDLEGGSEGILSTALGNDPRENALRKELAGEIERALGTLSAEHRAIIVLRELEGLSYEELAERLDIPKGTVMSRLFHARKKLQAALREYSGLVPADERKEDES